MTLKTLALGGNGIDPKVVQAALKVLEVARRRTGKVVSVDKANVFVAGKLWREVVDAALKAGMATRDIGGNLGTAAMTDAIIKQFRLL